RSYSCPRGSWSGDLGDPETPPVTPVLVGPTGVGKTAVVAAWGALGPITVVSADARQTYRGLDIGTAKPPGELLARVPHVGLDVVEPGERYSAGRFASDAAAWLAGIRRAGRQPVVVGGTGFYVRALAEGLFHEPPLDPARRERLRAWTARLPAARLRGRVGAGWRGLPRGGGHARGTAAGAGAAGRDRGGDAAVRQETRDVVQTSTAGRGTGDGGGVSLDARCRGGARSARCTDRRSLAQRYPSLVAHPPSRLT